MSRQILTAAFTAMAMLIAFALLRLSHVTAWSWGFVTSPLWITWAGCAAAGLWFVAIAVAARVGWYR